MNLLKKIFKGIFKRNVIQLLQNNYPFLTYFVAFKKYILIPTDLVMHGKFNITARDNSMAELSVQGVKNPLYLRPNTEDLAVFLEIFVNSLYNIKYEINCLK